MTLLTITFIIFACLVAIILDRHNARLDILTAKVRALQDVHEEELKRLSDEIKKSQSRIQSLEDIRKNQDEAFEKLQVSIPSRVEKYNEIQSKIDKSLNDVNNRLSILESTPSKKVTPKKSRSATK